MPDEQSEIIKLAHEFLDANANALSDLKSKIDDALALSIELLANCKGKIITSGLGKSGLVAKKIAGSLASIGIPAVFVHPVEAFHGDFGLISHDDVVIVLSHSGETTELISFCSHLVSKHIPLIAITQSNSSTLGSMARATLQTHVQNEGCISCSFNLVPNVSTLVTLALGEILVLALLKLKGVEKDHFLHFHPGGTLGKAS